MTFICLLQQYWRKPEFITVFKLEINCFILFMVYFCSLFSFCKGIVSFWKSKISFVVFLFSQFGTACKTVSLNHEEMTSKVKIQWKRKQWMNSYNFFSLWLWTTDLFLSFILEIHKPLWCRTLIAGKAVSTWGWGYPLYLPFNFVTNLKLL